MQNTQRKIKNISNFILLLFVFSLPIILFAQSSLGITNYFLDGQKNDVRFNPSAGGKIEIKLEANEQVKFNTVAVCKVTDDVCSRTTAAKYFYQTNRFDTTFLNLWNGKKGDVIIADGSYKIKVTMKDETSAATSVELLTPLIIVDSQFSPNDNNVSDDDVGASSDEDESAVSAHASQTALSPPAKPPIKPLTLDVGRNRLVSVGAPLTFRAKVDGGAKGVGITLNWSFGDGGAAFGSEPTHIYYFPGTYIVIASANQAGEQAVARVIVEVIQPQAEIGEVGFSPRPYVQIVNNSSRELNLGYWRVRANGQSLILPADTLIASQKKIYLPLDQTKIILTDAPALELLYPNGQPAAVKSFSTTKSEVELWRELQDKLKQLSTLIAARLKSK